MTMRKRFSDGGGGSAPSTLPRSAIEAEVIPGGWTAVVLLGMTNFCSFFQRVILSFMFVPLQRELGLSDTQIGLVAGPAFALTYMAASVPLGMCIDRFNRRWILILALSFWSLMTLGCGLASSFILLVLFRAGVGAGEAVVMPGASSVIGDLFGSRLRPVAFGAFFTSGASAILMSFLLGAGVAYWLSQFAVIKIPLVGDLPAWRATLLLSALLGFVLLPFLWAFLREPIRADSSEVKIMGRATGLFDYIRTHVHVALTVMIGIPVMNTGVYTFLNWMAVFFYRIHGWQAAKAGFVFALTCGVATLAGSIFIGALPGMLRRRGVHAATLLACLLVGLAVNGLGAIAMWVPNAILATSLLTLAFFGMMSGPVFALSIIGEIVPVHLRGRFTAIAMVSIGLVTQGAGPFLVGFLTDHVFRAPDGLRAALCCVWLTSMIVGGALLASALGKYPLVVLTPAAARSVHSLAPEGLS